MSLMLGLIAVPSRAQSSNQTSEDRLKELSLEQLGNVTVTSVAKAPTLVWRTPAAVYVITQDDIRRSGATSIPEALRLAPGVEVARINGDQWSIGIRGFGSNLTRSVLVLIDGRDVYTTLLAGTFWEVQDTLMEDIDHIEVIRGPGGTVWGPNAVNGVINVITKNSADTQGTLVSMGGGNEEQGFANVRYGGKTARGLNYRVYGKGFNRSAQAHTDGNFFDHWRAAQAGFRMDWSRQQRDTFTLQGDLYSESAGDNVNLVNYAPPFTRVVNGDQALSGGNVLGRWTRAMGEGKDIQIQAFYDRTNRHQPNFGDIRDTLDVDYLQRFRLGSRNQFSWGWGARASIGRELQPTTGLFFFPSSRTDQLDTAFIQDNISLLPNRLELQFGTKFLHTNYTGAEFEPSGRLLWTPSSTQTLWMAITHAVRTPSDGERDFNLTGFIGPGPGGVPAFARFNANPNFQSEDMVGYELGYRRLLTRTLYFSASSFFNQYTHLFSEDITGPFALENSPEPPHLLLPAQFGNGLHGTTAGGELAPEWRPTEFWRLRGSYSFLHMVLKPNPISQDIGSGPIVAGSSPQHQALVQSSFDLPRNFTLDFDYRYVSALPAIHIPAYSTGDAHLSYSFGHFWEVSVVGENLLQPQHYENPSGPAANVGIKRSFYGKLLWRSKEN
jgi:iron complex outermembrane receptor protein